MLLPQEPYAALEGPYSAVTESVATDHRPLNPDKPMTRPEVLLVDNDADDLFLASRSLETRDCEVVSARSLSEALRQIATQHFDVLITDLHMPEPGDGFAVVTAMRHSQPDALTLGKL